MGIIAPAYVTVSPSFREPDVVVAWSQVSGAFQLLPNGKPRVKLGSADLAVYVNKLDIRTKNAAGQTAYNQLPSVTPVFSYMSTPTYLVRVRAEYDHHDTAAAGEWGVALPQVYRLGTRQAHNQFMRTALLFGMNPALGEGLTNASQSLSMNLPADPNGNVSISTYDNGAAGLLLMSILGSIKTRTNNIGIGRAFTILSPQRVLETWQYNVVQLTQYQRPGAGTESTAGMVKLAVLPNGDSVTWVCDDTLIGKGAGGTDLIIFCMPQVELPEPLGEINTNEFAKVTPNFMDCTAQYCDMVAPREILTPIPGGAVDVLTEHRITSGWPIRPEALTLLSAPF
jgi:hypothetical protein